MILVGVGQDHRFQRSNSPVPEIGRNHLFSSIEGRRPGLGSVARSGPTATAIDQKVGAVRPACQEAISLSHIQKSQAQLVRFRLDSRCARKQDRQRGDPDGAAQQPQESRDSRGYTQGQCAVIGQHPAQGTWGRENPSQGISEKVRLRLKRHSARSPQIQPSGQEACGNRLANARYENPRGMIIPTRGMTSILRKTTGNTTR